MPTPRYLLPVTLVVVVTICLLLAIGSNYPVSLGIMAVSLLSIGVIGWRLRS